MVRYDARNVPLDRIEASSARPRLGVRVACHRFHGAEGFAGRSGAATPSDLAESGPSAAAPQNLGENERSMGRAKRRPARKRPGSARRTQPARSEPVDRGRPGRTYGRKIE